MTVTLAPAPAWAPPPLVRSTGPAPAKIMIVGEFPGESEITKGEVFVGFAGQELSKMLGEAGLSRSACFLTNVVRIRPFGNSIEALVAAKKKDITAEHLLLRDRFVVPAVRDGWQLLQREIEMVRPNVIIALGNLALWTLTGKWGITSWRGSVMQTDLQLNLDYAPKVVPTYSPSSVLRQWSWRQIAVHDLRRAAKEAARREYSPPDYSFVIRPDYSTVLTILSQLYQQVSERPGRLAVDIETRAGHIACIGLAWSKREALCIPLMCTERPDGYWPLEQESAIAYALFQLLTHPNVEVIGQNFLYDAQYFWRHLHFLPRVKRDTMLSQHVLFSNLPKGLDFLSSMYCESHLYWKDDGKDWDAKTGEDQLWHYNCEDCVRTFEVDDGQQAAITAMGLQPVQDFQQQLFWPVLDTMNRGLRVDTSRRSEFAMMLQSEIAAREEWLAFVLGESLNIKSPLQMQRLFYETLGQKPILNRKTGSVSCDDEALRKISEREPLLLPITRKIAELRSLGVFLSTFVNAPLDLDGRMRCSFNIAGTETYRFSSSKNAFGSGLNLQNIPKGGGDDELELPNIRSLFIPDPGMTFFDIDLASADLRIVVWEADEPEFKAMLKEGLDPYTEIAKEFYHDPSITKHDPRRQKFKSFAHGTNYLGTAKGLAERLGLGVHEAEQTQRWYFSRFPRIKRWQDDLKDQVLKRRMVQNVFGYRCYFFDRIEGTIFNQAAAWIPQSTVACLINRAYVKIYNELKDVQVLLQVHDSLAGQFPTHLGDWMVRQIVAAAEIPLPYAGDPLTIPVGVKTSNVSWGECG
jgi:DNA polymerase I-like protein with 3'-5' exonuclease and polymerase domains/uracil-DNA glycosylase